MGVVEYNTKDSEGKKIRKQLEVDFIFKTFHGLGHFAHHILKNVNGQPQNIVWAIYSTAYVV